MNIEFLTYDTGIIQSVNQFLESWNDDSEVITTKTSGSTGTPKTIELRKEHMIASAKATIHHFNLSEGSTALLCLSPETIGGKMMIVRSIIGQFKLFIVSPTSTPLNGIDQSIDFAAMVPLQVEQSIQHHSEQLQSVNCLIIGGAPISHQLMQSCISFGGNWYQTFGMTETISHIAVRKLSTINPPYKALSTVQLSTNNDQLVISAPSIGVDQLITNDIVQLESSTSFKWIGRKDFVFNSGGIKIHPETIELTLSNLISVPFFSSSIPDESLGQKHVLIIESSTQIDLKKSEFVELLGKYYVPKEIHYFSSFQRTASGKINRTQTLKQTAIAIQSVL